MTLKRSPHCPSCGAEVGVSVKRDTYRSRREVDGFVFREVTLSCSHNSECRESDLMLTRDLSFDHKTGIVTVMVEGNERWFENQYARRAAGEPAEELAAWTPGTPPNVGDEMIINGKRHWLIG